MNYNSKTKFEHTQSQSFFQSALNQPETYGYIRWNKEESEINFPNTLPTSDSNSVPMWDSTTDSLGGTSLDYHLLLLQIAADTKDLDSFTQIFQSMGWDYRSPDDILVTIDLAHSVGAYLIGRKLARIGIQKFPENTKLNEMSRILAPPQVTVSDQDPDPGIKTNRDWLKNNRDAFLGAWIALKDGELIDAADSMDELVARIGEVKKQKILLTKVY